MRGPSYLITALALSAAHAAPAEPAAEPICADRPGLGSATCTAPAGRFQLETGLVDWTVERGAGQRETGLVVGETALKYGLTVRSHVEIDVSPYVRTGSRSGGIVTHSSGVGDVIVRYKHRLTVDGAAIEVAAYPFISLPLAKRSIGSRKVEAGLVVPLSYAIADTHFSLALTPELDWRPDEDGNGRHLALSHVAGVGAQLSPRLSISAEIAREWDWDPGGTGKHSLAGLSAAWLARRDLQLDAGANFGLDRSAPDLQLYAGVAKLF